MSLKKFASLNKIFIRLNIVRAKMFKVDTMLSLFSSLSFLATNLLMWYLITDRGFHVDGWTYDEIIVFIAFSELFFGIEAAVFVASSRFWHVIHSGYLDLYYTRPLDPRLRFLFVNINYIKIISSFLLFIVILAVSNIRLSVGYILLGVATLLIAECILALIHFCFSYTAFWFGKMEAVNEVSDTLTWFNKYPLVIMPKAFRIVFKTILPFYFFSTFPAELVLKKLTLRSGMIGIGCLIASLFIWVLIHHVIWEKGRGRYESIHG